MKLLLDSANLVEIKRWSSSYAIAGVTTNPSLVAKEEKKDYDQVIKDTIATIGNRRAHLSIEVTTLVPDEIEEEVIRFNEFERYKDIDLYVKIPVSIETLPAITHLSEKGYKINATACMTAIQAKLASDAGASVVSFFFNRMIDYYTNAPYPRVAAIEELELYRSRYYFTPVICGSIRRVKDVVECSEFADYVTASSAILTEIVQHPKTVESINKFQEDFDKWRA